ncbi:MAG: A-macroglobulin complement component [Candidatus Melainabacteria bacterium]|nr:MAG: A-macroglobulin complement component [Candidatus Melainabacteria bacterium]
MQRLYAIAVCEVFVITCWGKVMRSFVFDKWLSRGSKRCRSKTDISIALGLTFVCLSIASSQAMTGSIPTEYWKKTAAQTLGSSNRFLTFMSTDKPLYQSGERVFIRGVMLDSSSHQPKTGYGGNAYIQVLGPRGQAIASGQAQIHDSIWSYAWNISRDQAGGEYTIVVSYPFGGHAPAERKVDVRSYRAPRLKTQLIFARDGYGPGDVVTASLYAKRAEGGIPANAKVTIKPLVDGVPIEAGTSKLDSNGFCRISFGLPQHIERGDGTLALVVEDQGVVETTSKTIPILLQSVDLQMFPEGGEIVSGFKNRVYVQAFLPNGKPADLQASVIEEPIAGKRAVTGVAHKPNKRSGRKTVVAHNIVTSTNALAFFRTEHEGMGRFEFTPQANKKYFLQISKPSGIKKLYPLPAVKSNGAVLHSESDVIKKGQPLRIKIGNKSICRISVSKQDREIASRIIGANTGANGTSGELVPIEFPLPHDVDGVLTVTVWNEFDKPLAERLIFREPEKALNITVRSDKNTYAPGEKAQITVRTTDENGRPISAMVGMTVTDDSVLQMIEKRDQPPRLPVMVFLEPEVKDLADAQFYLNPAIPKSGLATDLLLGTQGWRRFAYLTTDEFIQQYGDKARRVLAISEQRNQAAQRFPISSPHRNRASFGSPLRTSIGAGTGAALGTAVGAISGGRTNGRGAWSGTAIGAGAGVTSQLKRKFDADIQPGARFKFAPNQYVNEPLNLPEEVGRVEGPRDVNMFQVEPTVIDERHYTTGRAERHQKTSPTLPEGAPIPDSDQTGQLAQLSSVDKYTYFPTARSADANNSMFAVRVFSHQARQNRSSTDRRDFSETLFWSPGTKTDARTGEATISFDLSDSISTFEVAADGFSSGGLIGAKKIEIKSLRPFYAEAKVPLEVTSGDQIILPLNLVNSTNSVLTAVGLKVDLPQAFKLLSPLKLPQQLSGGERARVLQPIQVGSADKVSHLRIEAKAGNNVDIVEREIEVRPAGFPVEKAFAGVLEPGKSAKITVNIEESMVPASLGTKAEIFPTPLANLTSALERLIQDPYGCFEQTSSTSYPLTMAQQYFKSHPDVDPKLISTSREKLEAGYKKLVSFWCPDRGYEWFGHNPGHEPLTAYGLMHFADMRKVAKIDEVMFTTTRAWLMKQKDGKGGFTRKAQSIHTWTADPDCSNAYIVWSLLETGEPASNLKSELDSLRSAATASQDSYVVALAANAFDLAGDKQFAKSLMKRLASLQKGDGSIDKVKNSVVGSSGQALELEGVALATLAWLRNDEFSANVQKSMRFLAESCKAGRYGSTQSTVMSLRAILAYDKKNAHPKAPGKIHVFADGKPVADVAFDEKTKESIKLPDLTEILSPGEHEIELKMEGGSAMPYAVAANYNRLTPESSKDCKLDLSVNLSQRQLIEGSSAEVIATITNKVDTVVPNPVAIIGLPGGFEPRHTQLKELVKGRKIDAYEVRGREVVLYWRGLDKNEKLSVPISVIAAVPGKFTGPASRSYLYYTDEHKKWTDGLKVEIAAR